MTTLELTLPSWHMDGAIQIYDHADSLEGWLNAPRLCPYCGHEWRAVAAIGAMGIQCPACRAYDPFFVWTAPKGATDCMNKTG